LPQIIKTFASPLRTNTASKALTPGRLFVRGRCAKRSIMSKQKLNKIIAVEKNIKSTSYRKFTDLHH
jgi:hypothetical protein